MQSPRIPCLTWELVLVNKKLSSKWFFCIGDALSKHGWRHLFSKDENVWPVSFTRKKYYLLVFATTPWNNTTHLIFTCSKAAIETLEKSVIDVPFCIFKTSPAITTDYLNNLKDLKKSDPTKPNMFDTIRIK